MKGGENSDLAPHLRMGKRGEERAVQYLREQGWEIETCNFTTKIGEIDIIARRPVEGMGTMVAFVEVKSRQSAQQIAPELAVTARKRRTIARVARKYAERHGRARTGYRFDVISVDFGQEPPGVQHFEGAFDAKGNPY